MTSTTISRDTIEKAVADCYRKFMEDGAGQWHYVRVWPDGSITEGCEPWPCYPESEYFGRRPHPVTIWSSNRHSGLGDDAIEAEMDALDRDWFKLNLPDLTEWIELTGLTLED